MKKTFMIRTLKFLALLLPIVMLMGTLQKYVFRFADTNTARIHNFYREEENSLDVVLMGASEVFAGFTPGYAYDQYGYTSYLYAIDANPGTLYKSQLKEVLRHQDPQVLLVEVNGFLYTEQEQLANEARLRLYIENIPFSLNKLQTIWEYGYEDKLSCLFPFIKYHGDWNKERELDNRYYLYTSNERTRSVLKGVVTATITDTAEPKYRLSDCEESKPLIPETEACLLDFLEYCKAQGLENVIFVRFPHKLMEESDRDAVAYANTVGAIAESYGYSYWNLEEEVEMIGIDPMADYYNAHHLNIRGQVKMTDYLSKRMMEECSLVPMEQSEANRSHWEDAAFYTNFYIDYALARLEEGVEEWPQETPWFMDVMEQERPF